MNWPAIVGAVLNGLNALFTVLGVVFAAVILIVTFGEKVRTVAFDWALRPWRDRHPWRCDVDVLSLNQTAWSSIQGYGNDDEFPYILVNRGTQHAGAVNIWIPGMGREQFIGNAPAGEATPTFTLPKLSEKVIAEVSWSEGQRKGEQRVKVPVWNPRAKQYDTRGIT